MSRRAVMVAGLAAGVLAGAAPASAQYAEVGVSVGDSAYSPATLRVLSQTAVVWRWDGTNRRHTVTSDPGQAESFESDPGESPLLVDHAAGDTFRHVFLRPGEYRYYDRVSCQPGSSSATCASGMTGVVIVENRPPFADFRVAPSPATTGQVVEFDSSGLTGDVDGTVTRIDWDLEGDGVYERQGAPARVTRAYDAPGQYSPTIRATDDHGATVTRAQPLRIDAPPPPPTPPPGVAPPPPPGVVPPPTGGPGLRLLVARRQPLAALRRGGISMLVTCAQPCQVQASAGPPGVPAALRRVTAALSQAGSASVEVPLGRSPLTRLRARRRQPVAVRVVATAAGGHSEEAVQRVDLRAITRPPRALVGISDQRAETFSDPLLRELGVRHARLITPWNSIHTERPALDRWMAAVRAAGLEPLVAFERDRGSRCPERPCAGPSPTEYAEAVRAFLAAYPGVRAIQPWNEANHQSQPTGRNPRLAAAYYNAARSVCPRCRITAADLLDSPNMGRWLRSFRRVARGRPRLWGLHNYSDTNRFRRRGTETLLRLVPGEVWLTETGGVVRFETSSGRVALPYDEARAARAIDFLFDLVGHHARRIRRVYVYQWRMNNSFDRFDAGLVSFEGLPRPSYEALRQVLRAR